jgi:glyoxylase-like metal-dependent hydrolase (beta-lactamase superfamily II)
MGPEDNSIWSVPDSWIEDGDRIEIGAVTLRAVHTPGHTHGHIVFVDEQRKLLFTGDHVLPHITPSIGFEQVPRSGALRDFLASLDIVDQFDDHLMLPAHGPAGRPVRQRVAELKAHHETRLHDTLAAARTRGESTALEAAGSLTWRRSGFTFADLSLLDQVLAVNETLAHLEVLVDRGLLFAGERDGAQIFSPTGG